MKNKIAFANLRAEMAQKQINITQLAQMIGIQRSTLSNKLVHQLKSITYLEVMRISAILDKSPEYLFSELHEKERA